MPNKRLEDREKIYRDSIRDKEKLNNEIRANNPAKFAGVVCPPIEEVCANTIAAERKSGIGCLGYVEKVAKLRSYAYWYDVEILKKRGQLAGKASAKMRRKKASKAAAKKKLIKKL